MIQRIYNILGMYDCVDGKYLYNRCHLIGYQLTGENANKRNLITGTRSLNVDGMLPFENMVAQRNWQSCIISCNTCVQGQGKTC